MKTIKVVLKPGKEKPLKGFHPWIFSGAIDLVDDNFQAGDLVKVFSNQEEVLGIGYLNPRSQITIRMLSFQDETINIDFFVKRMERAKKLREEFIPTKTNAYRLIHSEGDFLPGLVLDKYGDYLAAQFSTAGMDALKPVILEAIKKVFPSKGIYERSDQDSRKIEGLEEMLVTLSGEEPPDYVEVEEYGNKFVVDIKGGQKTGFFLDQRESRKKVGAMAKGKKVLNCFAYTGGFSVYAAKAGANSITSVEIGDRAVNTMKTNFELNNLSGDHKFVTEDVFDFLRTDTELYDLIILDPPAFCKSKNQVNEAARGYKDINLFAMKRLASDGILFTSSCSSFIEPELFQKIVFGAAKDAYREVQIIEKTSHAYDHPINIYHPEGEYLKGLFLRVS